MNTSKQINVMVLLVFLAVIVTGAYTLWDPSRAEKAQDKQLESTVRRGAYLFSQNCRVCHGDAGEGGQASSRLRAAPALNRADLQGTDAAGLRDDAEYANDYKFVYYTITCGRVGKVMPAWAQSQGGPLNEEQIKQLTTFILNGAGAPQEGAGDATAEAGAPQEDAADAAADKKTPWDIAREFAWRGEPEFHLAGDDKSELSLTEAVTEDATTLTLNRVGITTVAEDGKESFSPLVSVNDRLSIVDEEAGETVEIFTVTAVDPKTNTVTVERGVGRTSAAAHEAGTELLQPPVPGEGALLERSCGQIAGAQAVTAPEPPSTALSITAKGIAWNKTALSAVADAALTVTVQNNDDGVPHNWHLTAGADPGGDDVATTEIENGIVTQTLNFGPLGAGEYYYLCDVHPNMEGVLTAYAAGTGPEGGDASATPATDAAP